MWCTVPRKHEKRDRSVGHTIVNVLKGKTATWPTTVAVKVMGEWLLRIYQEAEK